LLNVVLSRLVHLQRAQIATLKAVGYRSVEVGLHYLELVSIIVVIGAILGVLLGAAGGRGMMLLYEPFFEFPKFQYRIGADTIAKSLGITFVSALAGTVTTVWRVAKLPPATAMQPEAPPTYRQSLVERLGLGLLFGVAGRMVVRELWRRPLRTALSVSGVALSLGIMIAGRFAYDTIEAMVETQFETAQREDLTVSFFDPVDGRARAEIAALPGVLRAEPLRVVPARIRSGQHWRDAPVIARRADADLSRVVEWPTHVVPLPEEGIMLSAKLAQVLDVRVGDRVTVEVKEGNRESIEVPVTALAADLFSLQGYMTLPALHALLGEEDAISAVALTVDPVQLEEVERRLKDMPKVASMTQRQTLIRRFLDQTGETMWVTTLILTIFASTIAIGVVYNNARIALSVRARDLASLRVLGFTRREISAVLLGELAAYVVLAIPFGLWLGKWLTNIIMSTVDQEYFRLPAAVSDRTYAFSLALTTVAAALAALIVRKRLDKLDLVEVLKTRE